MRVSQATANSLTNISMATLTSQSSVSFVVDRRGKKTHALLPIREYERLMENEYDNTVADSRENDGTISLEEFKKRVRAQRISR